MASGDDSAVVSCGMATATIVESIEAMSSAEAASTKKMWRVGAARAVASLSVLTDVTPPSRDGRYDDAGIAVDRNALVAGDAFCGDACPEHGRNMVFASDDRAVAERAADVGDHARSEGKERRPRGGGDLGDEDVTRLHARELLGPGDDARGRRDLAWAGADAA